MSLPRVTDVEVVSAHHERAVVRVGDAYLKIDSDQSRTDVEVAAMELAGVPTPQVLWRRPPVLALASLGGTPLASVVSPDAWAAAGAMARQLHAAPLPEWPGWTLDECEAFVDQSCRWLVDNEVVPRATVDHNRKIADTALRPFPPVFTHGDFQSAHVFVDGATVVGIIDWADACGGDALFDLAVLTVGCPDRLGDVVRGYGADVDRDVIRGWWALRRLASIPWMVDHGYDPSDAIEALQ